MTQSPAAPSRLSWFDLSKLPAGTRVVFAEPHDIFPECIVPAGTVGTITENGLNEIWCALLVTPDDPAIRGKLAEWKGAIHLGGGLDPGADLESGEDDGDVKWHDLSPLALEAAR